MTIALPFINETESKAIQLREELLDLVVCKELLYKI